MFPANNVPLGGLKIRGEDLIEIVRSYPILYDTSHELYMRPKTKDDLWSNIGRGLNTNGKIVKEYWRKLRECHREALRRQMKKGEQDAIITKPWIYQQQMAFLLPFMKNRTNTGYPNTPVFEREVTMEEDEVTILQPSVVTNQPDEETDQPVFKKMRKTSDIDPALLRFIEDSEKRGKRRDELRQQLILQGQQQAQLQNDALYQFFISMYNTTNDLPRSYQRRVRRKVFEVISQAEDDAESEILSLQSNLRLTSSSSSSVVISTPNPTPVDAIRTTPLQGSDPISPSSTFSEDGHD